jgi:hypothetical protein
MIGQPYREYPTPERLERGEQLLLVEHVLAIAGLRHLAVRHPRARACRAFDDLAVLHDR